MPEIDFNEVMGNRNDRILLFAGALFGAETADVVRGAFSGDPGQFDMAAAKAVLDRLTNAVEAEEAKRIQREKGKMAKGPELSHPRRKRGRNFEGEITKPFLADVAKHMELPFRVSGRLCHLLESEPVQALADANGLDIRTGSNGGYPLDHLREFEACLQELDKNPKDRIRGFGPGSQPRDLLQEAIVTAEKAASKPTSVVSDDVLTQQRLFAIAEKHGFSQVVANRFWILIDTDEVRGRVKGVPFAGAKHPDGHGYYMEGVRALAQSDLSGIWGFGPNSQNYALLQVLATAK